MTNTTTPIEVAFDTRFRNVPQALAYCADKVEQTGRVVELVTCEGEFIRRIEPRRAN